ncbi:MAG: hypothetical protein ABIP95_06760 [Pelobium sp.]
MGLSKLNYIYPSIRIKLNSTYLTFFYTIFICCFLSACKKSPENLQQVFANDFEQSNLSNITGGIITNFNGSNVIGNYNNNGFSLKLDQLPAHEVIIITFDLNIHDSWDGNNKGNSEVVTGPDLWEMKVDGSTYIHTTFSNTVCNNVYCIQQSYPQSFPFNNDPGTGATNNNLPGLCGTKGAAGGGTSLYKIERVIRHDKDAALIEFKDFLKQSNVSDLKCDESWSLDNLVIKTAILK